nr:MAG TPA: hypothetical protein [Caudoviricetes sp.]
MLLYFSYFHMLAVQLYFHDKKTPKLKITRCLFRD